MNKGVVKNFGYTDWRLPDASELADLKDSYVPDVWLAKQGFTNVQSYFYWSSTTYAGNTSVAWLVYMNDGSVYADAKSSGYYVWPVRSGQ
ncbi:MAG: DUF1566 domain-containing protein [Nitrospirae bacterium]|nr:DUF1566 domain-containing protein [Nitrospirota bacterium]